MQCGYERVAGSGFADARQSEKVRRRKVLIALLVMQASSERRNFKILTIVPLEPVVRLGLGGLVGSRSTRLVNDVTKTRTGMSM